jgi:hypothetical protein
MKTQSSVEVVIEDLIVATLGESRTAREKHLFRQALHGLVRLAKAEQMLEIRSNVKKLTGTITIDSMPS